MATCVPRGTNPSRVFYAAILDPRSTGRSSRRESHSKPILCQLADDERPGNPVLAFAVLRRDPGGERASALRRVRSRRHPRLRACDHARRLRVSERPSRAVATASRLARAGDAPRSHLPGRSAGLARVFRFSRGGDPRARTTATMAFAMRQDALARAAPHTGAVAASTSRRGLVAPRAAQPPSPPSASHSSRSNQAAV